MVKVWYASVLSDRKGSGWYSPVVPLLDHDAAMSDKDAEIDLLKCDVGELKDRVAAREREIARLKAKLCVERIDTVLFGSQGKQVCAPSASDIVDEIGKRLRR